MDAKKALRVFRKSPSRQVLTRLSEVKRLIYLAAYMGLYECTVYVPRRKVLSFSKRLKKDGFYVVFGPRVFYQKRKPSPSLKISWDPNLINWP